MSEIGMRLLAGGYLVVLLLASKCEVHAQEAALLRAPNVQQCAHDSVVISWKTAMPQFSEIHFSTDKKYTRKLMSDTAATFHVVTLRQLKPEQLYHYRVLVAGRVAYESRFRTYPPPSASAVKPFAFWMIGDGGSGGAMQLAVAAQIEKLVNEDAAQFGLYLGDIVYDEGAEIAQDPHYFTPYQKILDRQVCWPTLGNHDTHMQDGAPYYNNRVLPVPDTLADVWHAERWYAFRYGPALFLALDSRTPEDRTQLAFLRYQLETHRELPWKFVFLHHPPYATPYTKKGKCRRMSEMDVRAAWSPVFEEFEVDFVFAGHNHSYQRSELRRDYFPEQRGVYYIVSGGGGESAHAVAQSDSVCHQPPLTQAVVQSETFHLVWARVAGNTFTLRAVDVNGAVFDTFEYQKSASTAPVRMETDQ
ncbi:MAG: metallophosphoesterase family protein [candidate division KSB1 bacterium]